jgi:hypothetical protein
MTPALLAPSALCVAAGFCATAIYVTCCEQPARLALDDRGALLQWRPSYARGAVMQAGLALLGSTLGFWWFAVDREALTAVGAALLLAGWPYTLIVIRPTIAALHAVSAETAGPATRRLIVKWGHLHLVRVGFGIGATICYLLAMH